MRDVAPLMPVPGNPAAIRAKYLGRSETSSGPDALQRLANHIEAIIHPPTGDNVLELRPVAR